MTAITLEAVQAKQAELAHMIQKLQEQADSAVLFTLPEVEIELRSGEHYAGTVLDADGKVKRHLVLMAARPANDMTWDDAMSWAQEIGGHLPDRQEQALLFANCKPHLKPGWHWSSEVHETNSSCAWFCFFTHGNQSYYHKSAEGAAVAVRRFAP